jgi:hypothetical protein
MLSDKVVSESWMGDRTIWLGPPATEYASRIVQTVYIVVHAFNNDIFIYENGIVCV